MALRGPGAKPLSERGKVEEREIKPWEIPGLSRANRVRAFVEDLNITQGKLAGSKLKLRPWQWDFIRKVYAENDEGSRPIRTAVLSMGRKNGKTQLAAALALAHLLGPESESRGEIYSAALTRDQAGKMFAEMVAILGDHPELDDRCNVVRFTKQIEVLSGPGKGSIYVALSADADSKLGLSPSFVVYDELGSAPNRKLFDALDTATGAREDPLLMAISTQAAADHHVFSEMVDYGLKVRDGEINDPSFHLTLHAAPRDADPWSADTWALANPAIGDFLSLDNIQRMASQAKLVPSKESAFRNLVLNQRVSAVSRFIHRAEWDACNAVVDVETLRGRLCYGGLDLGGTRDLTAAVFVFPADDGTMDVLPFCFMPENNIEARSDEDRVPYSLWAKQGHITLIPGATIDPGFIADFLARTAETYQVESIAFDRWRIEDLKRELGLIGATLPLVPHGQGFKDMSLAVDALERHVAEKMLRHSGHPVMQMCAANAVITRDPAGGRKLDKSKATGRIDALVALSMALNTGKRPEPETLPACLMDL